MKNDLIITRFKTEPIIGTKDSNDTKTFFGSKMVDVEDVIMIDESKIQYSEIYDLVDNQNNGYQYFIDIDGEEKIFLIDLFDVKVDNHSIRLVSQPNIDLKNNTQWSLHINWKKILSDYIFYKLKNRRTFKCVRYTDVLSENINLYIRDYITNNLLGRYSFTRIDFYVKYYDLEEGDEFSDPNLLFNPKFLIDVKNEDNLIRNINANVVDNMLLVNYKQTESSANQKFNYYFDLIFTKI